MPELIQYLIKFNIAIAAVYLFYYVLLRRLTFYHWNRYFLIGYTAICFVLPFLNIAPLLIDNQTANYYIVENIPSLPIFTHQAANIILPEVSQTDYWFIIRSLLYCGFVFMSARLIIQYASFRKIKGDATLVWNNPVQIYQVQKEITPFSFGNSIYINTSLHSEEELQEIINHEFIHVKQKHSLDILFAELLCIVAWYNPAAWLIRHVIRQNLEFIADSQVLQNGTDRKKYQYMLLKVMGGAPVHIINPFNFSSLKKRIFMMNKIKSPGIHLLKFLFILPLLLIMLVAFRQQSAIAKANELSKNDTVPRAKSKTQAKPKPASTLAKPSPDTRPMTAPAGDAKSILFEKDKVTVELKNEKKVVYDLKNEKQREEFYQKYQSETENHEWELAAISSDIAATSAVKAKVATIANVNYVNPQGELAKVQAEVASTQEILATVSVDKVKTTASGNSAKVSTLSSTATVNSNGEGTSVGSGNSEGNETASAYVGPISTIGEKVFEITKDFTKEKLDQLVADLKSKGYELKIVKSDFRNGHLVLIEADLISGADKSHFTASDFQKLVFTKVPKTGDEPGFQFYIIKGSLHVN